MLCLMRRCAYIPSFNGDTTINIIQLEGETLRVTEEYMKTQLRAQAAPMVEMPNSALTLMRWGTMMTLFLKNHCSNHIMILGHWLSKAFLDYSRPQVLLSFSKLLKLFLLKQCSEYLKDQVGRCKYHTMECIGCEF
jgi:hypothetical protein